MKFEDLITMCWRLVLRNRRRYKAVMAGIAFGTAGFIVIQTMGDSVEHKINANLELLGEATILKAYWDEEEQYHPGQFYMRDVAKLKKLSNLSAVAPVVSLQMVDAHHRTMEYKCRLFGVDDAFWRTQTATIARGRLISPSDVVGRKKVCVLGSDVVKYLFGDDDPLDKVVRVGNLSFRVIGILGGMQHSDIRSAVFMPINTVQNLFEGLHWIREIYIRVDDWSRVEWARQQVLELLKNAHVGYDHSIRIQHYPERIKKVQATVYVVKLFIYSALVVTLILGGIGITNVMLAAVQDRTQEIGLRKALGAKEEIILLQFLTESVLISVLAGVFGGAAGLVIVQVLKTVLEISVSLAVMTGSVIIGLAFTLVLGVLSGLYPSMRASRLDPVEAMKFE